MVLQIFECIARDDLKELWDRFRLDPAKFLSKSIMSDERCLDSNNQELIRFMCLMKFEMEIVWNVKSMVLLYASDENLEQYLKHFKV